MVADGQGRLIALNNTYKAVRIMGQDYNLYYSVWCNNEHELYDLEVSDFYLKWPRKVFCQFTNTSGNLGRPIQDSCTISTRPTRALPHR